MAGRLHFKLGEKMNILTRKEFQDDMAKLWSEAVHAEYKAQIEAAVLEEREAVLDLVDAYAKNNNDLRDAIRARGQA